MAQPTIIQITAAQKGEYINIYGLGDDSQVYEWFKNPGEWRPCVSRSQDHGAF